MTPVIETPEQHRHAAKRDLAALLVGIAALVFALAVVAWVIWQMAAGVHATGFDADGVRCYSRATQTTCIQTAPQH